MSIIPNDINKIDQNDSTNADQRQSKARQELVQIFSSLTCPYCGKISEQKCECRVLEQANSAKRLFEAYPVTNHCEICKRRFSETALKPVADHNHTTNQFRGWLCQSCNTALGMFADEPTRLNKAIIYLQTETGRRYKNLGFTKLVKRNK